MTETERITKLFSDLYDGTPWIDISLLSTLQKLSAKEAATRILPHTNTIWEITNHLISWRETILKRLAGEIVETPEDNYFHGLTDRSPQAWQHTLQRMEDSQKQWIKFLKKITAASLKKIIDPSPFTQYEIINGILQHDAYHLGQISFLRKIVQQ